MGDGFSLQMLLYNKLRDARLVNSVRYADVEKVLSYSGVDLLDEEVLFLKDQSNSSIF